MEHISDEDKARAVSVWQEITDKTSEALNHVQRLIEKVENGEISTSKGVSFLEVKYQCLLSYITDLTSVMNQKCHGKSIQNSEAIDRLVETRTVLEKMRPIDQKLKYQVDKMVKTATTGTLAANDPLRYKPNPHNLMAANDDDDEGDDDNDEVKKTSVYRPPKLAAVHYDGDETVAERNERKLEQARKRALSSSIMQQLRSELNADKPDEIKDTFDMHRQRSSKADQERTEYEEAQFIRLSVSKKERSASQKMRTMSTLNDITKFGDISALTGHHRDEDESPRKRRKSTPKGKNKKKKGFRKKRH